MKVLIITSHITSNVLPCFQRNKTGFGYMVQDIISSIAKKEQVEVLVSFYRFRELTFDGARYIGCSFWDIIKHLPRAISFLNVIRLINKFKMSRGAKMRLIYSWALTGYYRYIMKEGNYDIVHIHGCSFNTEMWIALCQALRQPFLVTLHGLNSFSDTVKLEQAGKDYERDFLSRVVTGEFPITVISTGMKKLIEKTYGVDDCANITVVCNSVSFNW